LIIPVEKTWRKMGTDGIQLELALVLGISFGSTLINGGSIYTVQNDVNPLSSCFEIVTLLSV
jgi:hypothetical protein